VIVGGGVGGLTSALALQRAGVEVEVHEKFSHLQGRATGFTLWSYAVKQLMDLGLDDAERIGGPIEVTEVRNQSGKLIEEMPVGDVSRKLGAPSCDARRADLQRALMGLLGDGAVQMGSECVGVETDGDSATAVLADGSRSTGDIVIGADGIHSTVRSFVAGSAKLSYTGHAGWNGVIDGFSHELLKPNRHVEIWARGSKGGIGDVGAGQVRWYVDRKQDAGHTDGPIDKDEILRHVDGWYELMGAAVQAADPAEIVMNEIWDLPPIETWTRGRVVLLGDSAHATAPWASMGACMTIDDAITLAGRLASEPSVDDALAAYQHDRKQRDEKLVAHSRKMGSMAMLHSPLVAWLRDEAMEHTPPKKMEAIAEELAKGE
jgi:2-polyprenyl-6-methoxyphenol hydroxylase-like FAD-dependent oxidoreductase